MQPPSGQIEGVIHYYPVRVFFEDTDLSGIAYHANYLKWCERARSDLLRVLGINQRAAFEAGEGVYTVSEAQIKWRRPARFDDELVIETRALELRAASARMEQKVMRGEELLAQVDIIAAFVTPAGRPRRQPEEWRRAFEKFATKDNQ